MSKAYYIEEIPMSLISATEKEIEKRLRADECRLAEECACQLSAYTKLNLKNGGTLYVARNKKYDSENDRYIYIVQLLDEDVKVIEQVTYVEKNCKHFDEFSTMNFETLEGNIVCPLTHIAMTVIRKNEYKAKED